MQKVDPIHASCICQAGQLIGLHDRPDGKCFQNGINLGLKWRGGLNRSLYLSWLNSCALMKYRLVFASLVVHPPFSRYSVFLSNRLYSSLECFALNASNYLA